MDHWDSRRTIKCVTNPKWKDNYGQLSRREVLVSPRPILQKWDIKFETRRSTWWHACYLLHNITGYGSERPEFPSRLMKYLSVQSTRVSTQTETKLLIHKFVEFRGLFLWVLTIHIYSSCLNREQTAAYPSQTWLHTASRGVYTFDVTL